MEDWNGEGLPPIGCECEARVRIEGGFTGWHKASFKTGFDYKIWFLFGGKDYIANAHDVEFRPIIAVDPRRSVLESLVREAVELQHDSECYLKAAIDVHLYKLTNLPPF